jgi:hypothetical protein
MSPNELLRGATCTAPGCTKAVADEARPPQSKRFA